MTQRLALVLAGCVATLGLYPAAALGKKAAPPACPGGRFVVEGARLIGADVPLDDAVVLANGALSIDSGCEPVTATIKAKKKFTQVSARWPACAGLTGPAVFRGKIDAASCASIAGVLKAKKSKLKRRLTARVSAPPAFTTGGFTEVVLTAPVVGPEGGTVAVTDPASPLAGLEIVVPPGATLEAVTFTVSVADLTGATGLARGASTASRMIRIGASGSEEWNQYRSFARPVRVTLPYTPPAEGEEAVRFYILNGDGTLEAAGLESQDQDADTITFLTSVFADTAEPSRVGAIAPLATAEETFNSYVAIVPTLQLALALVGRSAVDTGFDPRLNGWRIPNYGAYYKSSRGGNCFGFVAAAKHYFRKRHAPALFDNYRDPDATDTWTDDAVAIEYTSRVHNGLSNIWSDFWTNEVQLQTPSSRAVALSIVGALNITEAPVLLYIQQAIPKYLGLFGTDYSGAHAIMVYRVDLVEGGFKFHVYDPNHPYDPKQPFAARFIDYTHGFFGGSFATYHSGTTAAESGYKYNYFTQIGFHVGLSDAVYDSIKRAADDGFRDVSIFPRVTITEIVGANNGEPAVEGVTDEGEHKYTITDNAARIRGTILGGLAQDECCVVNNANVYVSNKSYSTPVNNTAGGGDGKFEIVMPVAQGENDFVVIGAENTLSHWAAFYRNVIESTFSPAALDITLTWTQKDSDVDLYVREPSTIDQDGDTVYYGHRRGLSTTNPYLDIDNTSGNGPEHYVAVTGTRTLYTDATQAPNLYGDYVVKAHYFADHDSNSETTQPISYKLSWRYLAFCPDPCDNPEDDGFWEEGSASGTLTAASAGNCCNIDNTGADWSVEVPISYPEPDPADFVIPDPPGVMLP